MFNLKKEQCRWASLHHRKMKTKYYKKTYMRVKLMTFSDQHLIYNTYIVFYSHIRPLNIRISIWYFQSHLFLCFNWIYLIEHIDINHIIIMSNFIADLEWNNRTPFKSLDILIKRQGLLHHFTRTTVIQ